MSTLFHNILRAVAGTMEIPVVICLLLLAFSVFSLGWWLAELLGERRHMNASLPRLPEAMRSGERPLPDCIAAAVCLCVYPRCAAGGITAIWRIWKSGGRCTTMPRPAPITSSPRRRGTDPWRS